VEFDEVIRKRKMVRAFTSQPLDPVAVQRILAAANRAPSAGFSQGYALLALEGRQLGPFWELMSASRGDANGAGSDWAPVTRAPLVVIPLSCKNAYLDRYALADKGWADRDESRWPVPYWDIDTGFLTLLMLLATVDEGLGALFFGIPPELMGYFRSAYGVPEEYTPIGAVAIGHPDPGADKGGSSGVIKRRRMADLLHYGRW
jgi:nitroreductase